MALYGVTQIAALQSGVEVLGSTFTDQGVTTTPQLHYLVRCINTHGAYGEPSLEGYYTKLARAFKNLLAFAPATQPIKFKVRWGGWGGTHMHTYSYSELATCLCLTNPFDDMCCCVDLI